MSALNVRDRGVTHCPACDSTAIREGCTLAALLEEDAGTAAEDDSPLGDAAARALRRAAELAREHHCAAEARAREAEAEAARLDKEREGLNTYAAGLERERDREGARAERLHAGIRTVIAMAEAEAGRGYDPVQGLRNLLEEEVRRGE